jgi:hypothetical protein
MQRVSPMFCVALVISLNLMEKNVHDVLLVATFGVVKVKR